MCNLTIKMLYHQLVTF